MLGSNSHSLIPDRIPGTNARACGKKPATPEVATPKIATTRATQKVTHARNGTQEASSKGCIKGPKGQSCLPVPTSVKSNLESFSFLEPPTVAIVSMDTASKLNQLSKGNSSEP